MHKEIHSTAGHPAAILTQMFGQNNAGPKEFFDTHAGLWSALSSGAAILSLIVGTVGLIFIWRQLKAGREAVEASSLSANAAAEAAKIAFASTRPWMKFEITRAILTFNGENQEEVGCQLFYRMENVGQTPAVEASLLYMPVAASAQDRDIGGDLESLLSGRSFHKNVYFPGDVLDQSTSTNFPFPRRENESFLGFRIVAAVVYKAIVGGEQYWTPLVMALQHRIPQPDRIYRFYRGMGSVDCITMLMNDETPSPT